MSDLQIVLMIFGGLIIIAVLIFNWWQERRFHQQVENTFSSIKSDALLEEPTLDTSNFHDHHDDIRDDDFSINHAVIQETEFGGNAEAAAETDAAHDARPMIEQTDYQEPEFVEPLADRMPVISEIMESTELPDANAAMSAATAEPPPASHEGIKAIFNDAFSKTLNRESTQSANSDQPYQQNNLAEQSASATNFPAKLNAQVDLIAVMQLAAEMTIGMVAGSLKEDFYNYDKPVFIYVQTPDLRWLLLNDAASSAEFTDQKIVKIACSLQLADRAGPVSRGMINRFQMAVESLGLDINAHVEWQSTTDPVADAAALDTFCIDVDKTMGFHLVHGENGAFTGTKLRGLAEAQGLELAADGSFKYFEDAAKKQTASVSTAPSFIMFNREHYPFSPDMLRQSVVKGITFQLDIPHVANCTEAFNHMVLVARQMETGLHAQLVDDNNRPLGDAQIEKIRHQLKIIQATMLARGITPGSDVALRLFS